LVFLLVQVKVLERRVEVFVSVIEGASEGVGVLDVLVVAGAEAACVLELEEVDEEREGRPIARRKRSFTGMVVVVVVVVVVFWL
jgi:hypothetical protein